MSRDNQKLEREFQNFIKDTLKAEGGYFSQLHPGMGSDLGIPDLLLAVDSVGILPTELKVGTIDGDELTSSNVRIGQVIWHEKITDHGYLSCVLIGVPHITSKKKKTFSIYAVDGKDIREINNGLKGRKAGTSYK